MVSGLGPAEAAAQALGQGGGKYRTFICQQCGRGLDILNGTVLAAKTNGIHCAQRGKKRHAAGSKVLGAADSKHRGHFHHQIGTAGQGHPGAQIFAVYSRFSPLYKIPAHDHHAEIRACQFFGFVYMKFVTTVKGIVFGNDSGQFHNLSPHIMYHFDHFPVFYHVHYICNPHPRPVFLGLDWN